MGYRKPLYPGIYIYQVEATEQGSGTGIRQQAAGEFYVFVKERFAALMTNILKKPSQRQLPS